MRKNKKEFTWYKILELIKQNGYIDCDYQEIANQINSSYPNVYQAIQKLIRERKIRKKNYSFVLYGTPSEPNLDKKINTNGQNNFDTVLGLIEQMRDENLTLRKKIEELERELVDRNNILKEMSEEKLRFDEQVRKLFVK